MERKLASIQKILDLQPIPNADSIEVTTVLGWKVVVKKGEFEIGDLCVYFEIDSVLPPRPEFEFLAPHKYRIRTVRLKGQISQGICFPTTIVSDEIIKNAFERGLLHSPNQVAEGLDVTQILGVTKYDPPMPVELAGKVRGQFPSFIPKTDETRIQAFPYILQKYKDTLFVVTEKVDGSSVTFFMRDGELHCCSRNLDLLESADNTIWQMAKTLDLENKLKTVPNIALQGELVGEKMQGNKLKIQGKKVLFFTAFDIDKGDYLPHYLFKPLIRNLGLESVPVLEENVLLPSSVDEAVAMATRKSSIAPDVWLEGLVFRPAIHEQRDEDLGRLSFKVINPEFLLGFKE